MSHAVRSFDVLRPGAAAALVDPRVPVKERVTNVLVSPLCFLVTNVHALSPCSPVWVGHVLDRLWFTVMCGD